MGAHSSKHYFTFIMFTEYDYDLEEELTEYDLRLLSAMEESEETGIPFDHIMGEILAGLR